MAARVALVQDQVEISMQDTEAMLHEGVVELRDRDGRLLRFGFMAALEQDGQLYVVLCKMRAKRRLEQELLLLRLIRRQGQVENYEVVQDPAEAMSLIDSLVRTTMQTLLDPPPFEGPEASEEQEDWEQAPVDVLH